MSTAGLDELTAMFFDCLGIRNEGGPNRICTLDTETTQLVDFPVASILVCRSSYRVPQEISNGATTDLTFVCQPVKGQVRSVSCTRQGCICLGSSSPSPVYHTNQQVLLPGPAQPTRDPVFMRTIRCSSLVRVTPKNPLLASSHPPKPQISYMLPYAAV